MYSDVTLPYLSIFACFFALTPAVRGRTVLSFWAGAVRLQLPLLPRSLEYPALVAPFSGKGESFLATYAK
jgi:hypothetical protein